MHFLSLFTSSLLASTALARSWQHVGKIEPESLSKRFTPMVSHNKRAEYGGSARQKIEKNAKTEKFAVDGKSLPYVDFDIGESYAGLLPISDKANVSELYFWFFPSDNTEADDEILIWLNGGPGYVIEGPQGVLRFKSRH